MKIVCVADQHGRFDQVVPPCDLLIVAGDMGFTTGTAADFYWWLEDAPAEDVVVIGGNMDFTLAKMGYPLFCRGHYLEDQSITLQGRRVHGTPWTPPFTGEWNESEAVLAKKFKLIPTSLDILVVHGPPYGYCDDLGRTKRAQHKGSKSLLARIKIVKPPLVVCGHIHGGHGTAKIDNTTTVVNAAVAHGEAPVVVDLQ